MRWITTEIGAVLAWVAMSLLLAALAVPWVHQAGQTLAGHAAAQDAGIVVEWLGAACGRAKYSRYFDRTLLASAVLLLPLLLWRVRRIRAVVPEPTGLGLDRLGWENGFRQWLAGFLIAVVVLWSVGLMAAAAGAFEIKSAPGLGRLFARVMLPALVTPVVEEWLFRGLLLGLWLRFSRPLAAMVGCSLVFAFLHFLEPPAGVVIASPGHPGAGFQLLGAILLHFSQPSFLVEDFAALFGVGWVLSWVRYRTRSLWLPMGLHTGWILAFKGFNVWHDGVGEHALERWGVGADLRSGLLPLLALAMTVMLLRRLPWIRQAGGNDSRD